MATVQDLVSDALLEIGVLSAGETLGAEDGASGLRTFNRMLDGFRAERVFAYTMLRNIGTITSGTGTYLVGTGSTTFAHARPARLDAVTYYDTTVSPTTEIQLGVLTDQRWTQIQQQSLTATVPTHYYYRIDGASVGGVSAIYGVLTFWPVPTATTLIGVIYYPKPTTEFSALTDPVLVPAGYQRMFVKNLAVELAPQYGASVSDELKKQAVDSLAVVMRASRKPQEIQFPPDAAMNKRSYDIWSDVP